MIGDVVASPLDLLGSLEPERRLPLRKLLPAVEPLDGARLLDVGCGIGRLLRAAAEQGAVPTGVERVAVLLEIVRWALPDANLQVGRPDALPFGTGYFDLVTAFDVLRPSDDHDAALAELTRVIRPGGRLALGHWTRSADRELPARLHSAGLDVVTEAEIECADDSFHYLIARRDDHSRMPPPLA